jgi:hypothetical protein
MSQTRQEDCQEEITHYLSVQRASHSEQAQDKYINANRKGSSFSRMTNESF